VAKKRTDYKSQACKISQSVQRARKMIVTDLQSDAHSPGQRCIRDGLSPEAARDLSLVLAAVGIGHRIAHTADGSSLWVRAEAADAAQHTIVAYERENAGTAEHPGTATAMIGRNWSGVGLALFIMAVHIASSGNGDHGAYVQAYGASAAQILSGELYRTVTALILHADWGHLAANMAGSVIFATAVCAWVGSGVGVLLILATGVVGNWISAAVYQSGHTAIGASTAVFGALGLIAAHQFIDKISQPGMRIRAWLPMAGALALLGFLGVSERSDVLAHFFGLVSGLGIGGVTTVLLPKAPGVAVQNGCLALSLALVVMAWMAGLG
jgi:membrane associated rhomboid family serine protease